MYFYTVFDLTFQSDFACPELVKACGSPDVSIHTGTIPKNLKSRLGETDLYLTDKNHFIFKLDGIADYLVRNGNEIIVEPAPSSNDSEVRLYLYGTCFGALLHQRGLLVLHASAIQTGKGAVLFTGPSGWGKSTALTVFLQRGYSMLADDVTAITLDPDGLPLVLPAIPRTKIWSGIATNLGYDLDMLPRQRPNEEKYELDTREQFHMLPTRLSHIYQTYPADDDEIKIEPIDNLSGFQLIIDNIYRKEIFDDPQTHVNNLRLASIAANHSIIRRISGPGELNRLDEVANLIEEDFNS